MIYSTFLAKDVADNMIHRHKVHALEIEDKAMVKQMVGRVIAGLGRIGILINNTVVTPWASPSKPRTTLVPRSVAYARPTAVGLRD